LQCIAADTTMLRDTATARPKPSAAQAWLVARRDEPDPKPEGDAMHANPYLEGNFAPVTAEVTATRLPVTGRIPESLTGRYLRNGPNPRGAIDAEKHHWFIGHGMVHGVRLERGQAAWYRNRWIRTAPMVQELGEDLAGRALAGPNNTHVIGHAGRTWALVEAGGCPVELTDTLETVGANAFFGTLADKGFTAHPRSIRTRATCMRCVTAGPHGRTTFSTSTWGTTAG